MPDKNFHDLRIFASCLLTLKGLRDNGSLDDEMYDILFTQLLARYPDLWPELLSTETLDKTLFQSDSYVRGDTNGKGH